ncbi:hypothetical protein GCM10009864_05980 [Streptomyces lunalinharesii]|uniref:Uncharacterized protein n=1 Tax=Streptomyces lunalinharesii TaxID=333384 RepID=A0ABN3R8T2_9ACTN
MHLAAMQQDARRGEEGAKGPNGNTLTVSDKRDGPFPADPGRRAGRSTAPGTASTPPPRGPPHVTTPPDSRWCARRAPSRCPIASWERQWPTRSTGGRTEKRDGATRVER